MDYITLNNGVKMPQLGFGVYQIPPEDTERSVRTAIEAGYRSIDTAQTYYNEAEVGKAIAHCGVPREELFITTKVWITNAGEKRAAASIDESLQKLDADYIDLLLIHQPFGDYYGSWRAMEAAYKAGKVRAIGVANFMADRFIDLAHFSETKPAVNQLETHVFQQQKEIAKYHAQFDTKLMSWGPFAEGRNDYFNTPALVEIGAHHGKSAAQIALRYMFEQGVILIPKSVHEERIRENIDIFDFALTDDERAEIAALDTGKSLFFSHHDPETVSWFMSLV